MTQDADWLAFAKQRALEYLDAGHLDIAFASLTSDLMKDEGTASLMTTADTRAGYEALCADDAETLRTWINHFSQPDAPP